MKEIFGDKYTLHKKIGKYIDDNYQDIYNVLDSSGLIYDDVKISIDASTEIGNKYVIAICKDIKKIASIENDSEVVDGAGRYKIKILFTQSDLKDNAITDSAPVADTLNERLRKFLQITKEITTSVARSAKGLTIKYGVIRGLSISKTDSNNFINKIKMIIRNKNRIVFDTFEGTKSFRVLDRDKYIVSGIKGTIKEGGDKIVIYYNSDIVTFGGLFRPLELLTISGKFKIFVGKDHTILIVMDNECLWIASDIYSFKAPGINFIEYSSNTDKKANNYSYAKTEDKIYLFGDVWKIIPREDYNKYLAKIYVNKRKYHKATPFYYYYEANSAVREKYKKIKYNKEGNIEF